MSTGAEHYAEAERLLADAVSQPSRDAALGPVGSISASHERARDLRERAQVHATLALAAATAYGGIMRQHEYGGRGVAGS